ncbi:uncharacterized protein SCHCODRAFT_01038957 [Schizophyllum commune H4-8]|uniref:uncharacterized protein n=1 Tax=Schizophyllum commune (strain H4-8 / FGSC 9210) TaxID=578458 RepID=UPI002160B9B9|nr:uncharacterized protein SCHCODRAFT_01038957 [Schizophyllum commune H4-8]KAI5888931.1 hypothetical protein SCHCODRAFT_01038957 [Schizophyllum commune H4-8]
MRETCGECKRKGDLKMCICGSVCYCSADCQRRAWRKSHREVCFCGPVRICLDGTNTVRSAHPDSLTHSERAYFRHCTHAILRKNGEPEKLRSVRSVVVDLVTFALATKRIWRSRRVGERARRQSHPVLGEGEPGRRRVFASSRCCLARERLEGLKGVVFEHVCGGAPSSSIDSAHTYQ